MADIEKYIEVLSKAVKTVKDFNEDTPIKFSLHCVEDILELLKKQHPCVKLVNERDYIVHYTGDDLQLLPDVMQELVRCKDCKHRPKKPNWATFEDGGDIEFPENSKCPCQNTSDRYYSWYPDDDWFCADGERKDDWSCADGEKRTD
jgi:hypothetical protein